MKRNQLKGYKSHVTKQFKSGYITEAERKLMNKRLNNARATLNAYIKHFENDIKTTQSSGIRRGGNVMFFNNVKQLLKKLE